MLLSSTNFVYTLQFGTYRTFQITYFPCLRFEQLLSLSSAEMWEIFVDLTCAIEWCN